MFVCDLPLLLLPLFQTVTVKLYILVYCTKIYNIITYANNSKAYLLRGIKNVLTIQLRICKATKMDDHHYGNPNNVQIGINDTALTLALQKGEFKAAEKIIEDNTDVSLLNEGAFEKIPLALVLSSDPVLREFPRHLRLAKLLIERGANPNLRIPHAEWQGATASPMEYLVYLIRLTNVVCKKETADIYSKFELMDPMFTIGLHDESELTASELREQLLELLDVFLAFGGNPNVTTITANSTVYHVALSHADPDMDLVMKLCEAGGDLNQSNVHGTTPLMELITYAEGDAALEVLQQIWSRNPNISSLQAQNCANETALWRAMFAGSPQLAIELINRAADPAPRAMNMIGKSRLGFPHQGNLRLNMQIVISGLAAILAPLLQDSSSYVRLTAAYTGEPSQQEAPPPFSVALLNKVFSTAISPVVDYLPLSTVFTDPVLEDLNTVIYGQTKFAFHNSEALGVAALIFGKLKAGLQQMCVRQILHQVFFAKTPHEAIHLVAALSNRKVTAEKKKGTLEESLNEDKSKPNSNGDKENQDKFIVVENMNGVSEWEVIRALNEATLTNLVRQRLKLPTTFIPKFQVETARLQLGSAIYSFESVDCMIGCDDHSEEGSSQLTDDFDYDDDDLEDDDDDESDWLPDFMSSDEYDLNLTWGEEDDDDDDGNGEGESDDGEGTNEEEQEMDKENADSEMEKEVVDPGIDKENIDQGSNDAASKGATGDHISLAVMDVDSGSEESAAHDASEKDDVIMCCQNSSASEDLEWEDIDREQYETLEDLGFDDSST